MSIYSVFVDRISCTRCLAIHFTLEHAQENEDIFEKKMPKRYEKHTHSDKHSHENCRDCEYRRQIAGFDSLPESVVQGTSQAFSLLDFFFNKLSLFSQLFKRLATK